MSKAPWWQGGSTPGSSSPMHAFLSEINLEMHLEAMERAGYDDVSDFVNFTTDSLERLRVALTKQSVKDGHIDRIARHVAQRVRGRSRHFSIVEGAAASSENTLRAKLVEVDLMKLHAIDVQNLSFKAQIWVKLVIAQGACDPQRAHLIPDDDNLEREVFPKGADGKPTFRPSAGWYMAQVDFRSALDFKKVDTKIKVAGDDLHMEMRYEGVFSETYELQDFPFDQQGLTINLNFNCRVGGPLPIELEVDEKCPPRVSLSCIQVCRPAREWEFEEGLCIRAFELGGEGIPEERVTEGTHAQPQNKADRIFPAISFTAHVKRRPMYHVLNTVVPMGLFSVLALVQAINDKDDASNVNSRSSATLGLVLTASAYKVAIAGKMPPVSYLTWTDLYFMSNFLLIIAMALQSRCLSQMQTPNGDVDPDTRLIDHISVGVLGVIWLGIHVYFGLDAARSYRGAPRDDNLRDRKYWVPAAPSAAGPRRKPPGAHARRGPSLPGGVKSATNLIDHDGGAAPTQRVSAAPMREALLAPPGR